MKSEGGIDFLGKTFPIMQQKLFLSDENPVPMISQTDISLEIVFEKEARKTVLLSFEITFSFADI